MKRPGIFALFLSLALLSQAARAEREDDQYRMGDEWGKKPVTQEMLQKETAAFKRAAYATAKVGGATGFYLGKFGSRYLMATNHHVFETAGSCSRYSIEFPLQDYFVPCKTIFGSWPEIDLAIFEVQLTREQEAALAPYGKNFAFNKDVTAGENLMTFGFGFADNWRREMVVNQDSDCKVFSGKGEYRLLGDPDDVNPADYKAWSFSNGCDVSHGDSGSAMVDRTTGEVMGIIWTGRIPKSAAVQSSAYLDKMFQSKSEEIWTQLSYAVPAAKMKTVLSQKLKSGELQGDAASAVKDLLAASAAESPDSQSKF